LVFSSDTIAVQMGRYQHNLPLHCFRRRGTHLVAHQALLALLAPSIPLFKVPLRALPVAYRRKIEEYGGVTAVGRGIAPAQRAKDDEFLGRRVRDGCQEEGADRDADGEFFPVVQARVGVNDLSLDHARRAEPLTK
jgi:hypothetical protein